MQALNFEEALDRLVAGDARYHRQAYFFLREALEHTHKMVGNADRDGVHHVTPQQLVEGLREYALQQFGPMAMIVLQEWGVRSCEDWGEIVFGMIKHNLLAKTEQDKREDFKGHYDFFQAFRQPFYPSAAKFPENQPQTEQPL
jgi:uncharacterized repeat protein (TIGR04138 family)